MPTLFVHERRPLAFWSLDDAKKFDGVSAADLVPLDLEVKITVRRFWLCGRADGTHFAAAAVEHVAREFLSNARAERRCTGARLISVPMAPAASR